MRSNQFKTFEIEFLHTDGDIRFINMQAYNEERARMRFYVNWDKEMKILNVKQKPC